MLANVDWKRRAFCAVVLSVLFAVAGPVFAGDLTVGDFIRKLAEVRGTHVADAGAATRALGTAGIALPESLHLEARLTEADVVGISRALGLDVTTSRPDRPFSDEQAVRYFETFAVELNGVGRSLSEGENPGQGSGPGNGNEGPPFDPFTKGRGVGKGKGKGDVTPTVP